MKGAGGNYPQSMELQFFAYQSLEDYKWENTEGKLFDIMLKMLIMIKVKNITIYVGGHGPLTWVQFRYSDI